MTKIYTLPAVTRVVGQDTSVGVLIDDDAKFREWLSCVKRRESVDYFRFRWSKQPRGKPFSYYGKFWALYKPGGIYIKPDLCYGIHYRGLEHPLNEFCRMVRCNERPSFGLRVTVKV